MTAAAVAKRLGLSEAAVAAFSGTAPEFAQHFGKSLSEATEAVADLAVPPGAPTAVTVAVSSPTGVALSFTPPADDGGAAITGYVVTSAPAITLTYNQTDTTSPIDVSGTFASGVAYTFTMAAKNSAGTGAASAASAATTPNP